MRNLRAIGPLFMDILHLKELGYIVQKRRHERSLHVGVVLVIDICYVHVVPDTSPLYTI